MLVTGAGGFIGGRVTEILHARGVDVRAGLRRWSAGARVGRLPVDLVACDVMRPEQLASAMEGVEAVVHCAVGDHDVTVTGTRNVLEAAIASGVRRVVFLSTIDVYGFDRGVMEETRVLRATGRAYGDSKLEAEAVCREYLSRGLEVVILRPTIVYGPFSQAWVVEFAERMLAGAWTLPAEDCGGVCNLVYVDDLVEAVIGALHSSTAVGEAFNINGAESPTWQDYFTALNGALRSQPLAPVARGRSHVRANLMMPVRRSAKFALRRFGGPIRYLHQRFTPARRMMKWAEERIRQTPTTAEFRLYSYSATFPTGKAERLLGYRPSVTMARGIERSVAWMRHEGIAPAS